MILTLEDVKVFRQIAIANKMNEKFIAERRMSDKTSVKYDKYTPTNWFQKVPIIPNEETPPASGYGYTQSPYISQWTKMWGVNPLTDLPKYRMMYRTVPIIKKAVDKTVATAISKGFELDLPPNVEHREDILDYLKSWLEQQEDFKIHLQMLASDALTYGNAYAEIVYDEIDVTEEHSDDPEFQRVEIADPQESMKMGDNGVPYLPTVHYNGNGKYLKVAAKGNPVWIKPLDPLWMRVRRDSYGNVFGYLQYLSTPPVAFTNDKTMHIRFNPKSWWTENAYGTSMLLSLVRTQEAIWTIENDLILISHACAKPPLVFACGEVTEEPWTEGQFTAFVTATSARGPGGDIYHRGDVNSKPLPFPASSLAPLLAHLDYHVEQRMVSLGVPPDLLGVHASSNRSVATVSFDDWINTIQMLQQQMGDAIQEQLFKPIVEKAFGEGCPVPKMVWNQVYEKDDAAEIQKIMTLRASNIITTNEARAWLSEVGKAFEPVTDGDTLFPPEAFMPAPEESVEGKTSNGMPPEDAVLEDELVKAEASAKLPGSGMFKTLQKVKQPGVGKPGKDPISKKITSTSTKLMRKGVKSIFGAEEEEYSEIKIRPAVFSKPRKKSEEVHAEEEIQGFSEPGAPSGTGENQLMYPLLNEEKKKVKKIASKDKRALMLRVASKIQSMETPGQDTGQSNPFIRAEQDKLTGQGQDEPVKDLTSVKIKQLDSKEGVDVWLVSGDKVAARYSNDWKHSGSSGVHDYIGGHHFVFDYIPENEVWVSDLDESPEKTALHELVERKAMKEEGLTYADAHIKALKAEGADDADVKRREYLQPKEVKESLTKLYPKIEEKENTWKLGNKVISFNDHAGIIYVHEGDKITDQLLVRSTEDIEKFVEKHRNDSL